MNALPKKNTLLEASKELNADRRLLREFANGHGLADKSMTWLEHNYNVVRSPVGRHIEKRENYTADVPPFNATGESIGDQGDNRPDSDKSAIDGHRPDSNPKSALGIKKVPLHLVSPISILHEAMAMAEGGMKYGPYNYRADKVAATVYIAAALRHIMDWSMGEDNALDSGIHHLAHAKACCGILLDAQVTGSLIDDRYKTEAYRELLDMYTAMLPAMAERIEAMSTDLEAHNR